ncbi:MAG: hypothetical protein K940chlam9_00348 [Chlamydiae bacterium]|nr:hypothetical protein [Chlamydiota bacterium]
MAKVRDEIIEYPENWDDMVKKHKEREEEAIQRMMHKRKVEDPMELLKIASEAIATRQGRTAREHRPLKDWTIKIDAESEQVNQLKMKLDKETTELAQKILSELPQQQYPELRNKLKGRISPPSTATTDEEATVH